MLLLLLLVTPALLLLGRLHWYEDLHAVSHIKDKERLSFTWLASLSGHCYRQQKHEEVDIGTAGFCHEVAMCLAWHFHKVAWNHIALG